MELKELIGETLYTKEISDKLDGHQVIIAAKDEKYVKDDGSLITKDKMNEVVTQRIGEVTEQKKILTDAKTELETQLAKLKSDNKGNEELIKQVEEMEKQIADRDKKIIVTTKRSALERLLTKADAIHPELLISRFDIDKLELDGDTIKGWKELISPIKEGYPESFGVKKPVEGDDGNAKPPGDFTLTLDEKKAAKDRNISEEDYYEILKKNKEIKTKQTPLNW